MKPLILVVDDNNDILMNIRITLEQNNFEVITSSNGQKALNILSNLENVPDLIISDIMMPIIDGYDFFLKVSSTPKLSRVPFIFLTAKSSTEDVRFGKILGVDDYITKPFEEEDLLATINGKIRRKEKIDSINRRMDELIEKFEDDLEIQYDNKSKCAVLLIMLWDDKIGPKLVNFISLREQLSYSLEDIGRQLFQASVSIYGQEKIKHAKGLLVDIDNIKRKGYIYFDSYKDGKMRGGEQDFMIAFITNEINYLASLEIRKIFKNISKKVQNTKQVQLQKDFQEILKTLTEYN
ncbi:MAG: PleD family two-component system response regulator [Candidatus Thorarchaeota archaeon]